MGLIEDAGAGVFLVNERASEIQYICPVTKHYETLVASPTDSASGRVK